MLWRIIATLLKHERKLKALKRRQKRLEKLMTTFTDTLKTYDADVQTLIQKETLTESERDAAQSALDKANAKLAGGSFVSDDEKAEIVATAAALHQFLNLTPTTPAAPTAPTQPTTGDTTGAATSDTGAATTTGDTAATSDAATPDATTPDAPTSADTASTGPTTPDSP